MNWNRKLIWIPCLLHPHINLCTPMQVEDLGNNITSLLYFQINTNVSTYTNVEFEWIVNWNMKVICQIPCLHLLHMDLCTSGVGSSDSVYQSQKWYHSSIRNNSTICNTSTIYNTSAVSALILPSIHHLHHFRCLSTVCIISAIHLPSVCGPLHLQCRLTISETFK